MLKNLCLLFTAFGTLQAQQVAAPTPETVGPPRGESVGNYNLTQSFETGYRWSLVGGNLGEYRSDVNYRNGLRLLGSSFSIDSKDGHGHWFDQILLNTLGLGNDPYQSAILRVQKNGLYRYDMTWRLDDYYNPGLTVSGGLHLMDTIRRIQDHDLVLLPQSHFKFRAGYSRNTQTGPALSTAQEFDLNGSGLPVFSNVRRQWNEYRLGADAELAGFKFTVLRRWDFYKDDTAYSGLGPTPSGSAGDLTVLNQFRRADPVHGSNPGWLGNLYSNRRRWAMNARISYLSGHRDFALDESASGFGRFGAAANRQIVVTGNAERPMVTGDFNLSLFPTSRLTIVNNTSVNSLRISGPSAYSEMSNVTDLGQTVYFRYLGVRLVTNSTDANYRVRNWIGFYAGYHYTDRLVRTIEGFSIPAFADSAQSDTYETTNHLNSGTVGIRLRPVKPLTVNLEGEIGRADNPLTPISERNYHSLGGRADYRVRKLQISTSYRQLYNVNSPLVFSAFSSHSRNYTASASWAPQDWFALDASYMKLHLDTVSSLAFFAGVNRPQLQAGQSLYLSNIHAANLGARVVIRKRTDIYFGYTITKDTGDGRSTAIPATVTDPVQALLSSVQTFPLTYQSPLVRASIRISPKVRWNVAWQFYDYGEHFHLFAYDQNFHAHTGYTSILWSF